MEESTLSLAVTALREHLSEAEGQRLRQVDIKIGHPGRLTKTQKGDNDILNIFVFQVEHSGYPAHGSKDEPYFVKLHCLLTPMTDIDDTNNAKTGVLDLQLLGHAMEILHRNPIVIVKNADETVLAQLEVVPAEMGMEEVNRIFSTQFETSYRVSAAYELAMVPVFVEPSHDGPRIAAIELGFSPDMKDRERLPDDADAHFETRVFSGIRVDTHPPDWQPRIILVDQGDHMAYAIKHERTPGTDLQPARVLGFGGGSAKLRIQRRIGSESWTQLEDRPITLRAESIDPGSDYSKAQFTELPLHGPDAILDQPGQAWIWIERVWRPKNRSAVIIRSNVLSITIQEAQP